MSSGERLALQNPAAAEACCLVEAVFSGLRGIEAT